jgi:hypothetical protein
MRQTSAFIGSQRGNLGLQAEEEPLSFVVVVVYSESGSSLARTKLGFDPALLDR